MSRLEIKASLSVDDAGTITGIAWPFGTPDMEGDLITKGAFSHPGALPMLWAHDQSQVVGVWDSITETAKGLEVRGRLLVDEVERAREVRAIVKAGGAGGLSIGFQTKKAAPRQGGAGQHRGCQQANDEQRIGRAPPEAQPVEEDGGIFPIDHPRLDETQQHG